ncbi:ribbon-helix-helix domain-containing protein [Thermodesulfobacteriota bacterium]
MANKKTFSTRIDAERLRALKHLAVDEDKSIGVLLEEAIEELLKKYEHTQGEVIIARN